MSRLQSIDAERHADKLSTPEPFLAAASIFTHPDDVVADPGMTLNDKRALLASWASDAHAVMDRPAMRRLTSGAVVSVADIFRALRSLNYEEG